MRYVVEESMNVFTVAFFGHKRIEKTEKLEKCLDEQILRLLAKKGRVKFLVGCDGEFDQLVSESVGRVRAKYQVGNSDLVMIVPNLAPNYMHRIDSLDHLYADVEISIAASMEHPKHKIHTRNREMIDRADLILCYLTRESPIAWKSVQYAISEGKMVINLAEIIAPEERKKRYKDLLSKKEPLKIEF